MKLFPQAHHLVPARWHSARANEDRRRFQVGLSAVLAQRAAKHTFKHLWDAEVSVFSQWGEDGILDYLCEHLDLSRPSALEVGAGNFNECNTRFLAAYRNASVLAADGRPDLEISVKSSDVAWRTNIVPRQEWITTDSALGLYRQARDIFGSVDILSLDMDGIDYWVAERLPLESVKVFICEYNGLFGGSVPVSVPLREDFLRTKAHYSNLYFGASLPAFVSLSAQRGLSFVGTNRAQTNAFFVRSDVLKDFPLALPDPSDLTPYTDLRVRESRTRSGELSFLSGADRLDLVADLPVVNVETGDMLTVSAAAQEPRGPRMEVTH